MTTDKKNSSVVILAAGNSSRMGFPKPFLKWDEKTFFLEKIIQTYAEFGCDKIIVVTNPEVLVYYQKNNYTFLNDTLIQINEHPELPRFLSVKLGLENLQSDYCFIQNTDNPFVTKELLTLLSEKKHTEKYIVPVNNNKSGHPILLGKEVCHHIKSLTGNEHILKDVLKRFDRISVETKDPKIHCNINTQDDYTQQGFIC